MIIGSKMLQNVRRCDDSDAIEKTIADIEQYKTTESDPYVEPASMPVVDERLAAIFTIADPRNRGQELVKLALSLPSSHRSKVIQGLAIAVDSIKAPTLKAPLLRSLIDLLEHPERQRRFSEAIELAQAIPEHEERAQHLLGLVPFVRESQKQLLLKMTEEARSGYDVAMAFESAQTIAAPFDKARALLDLVSRLPEKEANLARKQIWDVVNGEGPSKRALLLMPFMGVLKEGELQAAFAAAYKLSQELEDPELRIQLLDSLASFANASDAIMLKGIADSIRKPGEGARALAEIGLVKEMEDRARRLIELIPVLTGDDRNTAFDLFREASRSILDGTMAVLWPSLVGILHVSERQVLFDQALQAARTMDDPAYRAMIYAGLSDIGGTSHQQDLRKEAEKEVVRSRAYSVVDELLAPRLTRLAEYGLEDQAAEVALGHAEAFDRALLLAEIGRRASRARRKRIFSLAYDAALEVEELERRIWLLFNIVTQMEAEEAQSGMEVALDLVSQVDNPIVAAAMTVGLTRSADPERRRRACQPHLRLVWRAEDLLQWPSLFRTPRLYLEDESHIKTVVMPMLADVGLLNPIVMTTGRGRASVLGKLHRAVGWLPPPETYAIWEEIRADVSSEPRRTLLDVLRLEWGLIQSLAPAGVAAQAISAIRRTSDQWP